MVLILASLFHENFTELNIFAFGLKSLKCDMLKHNINTSIAATIWLHYLKVENFKLTKKLLVIPNQGCV